MAFNVARFSKRKYSVSDWLSQPKEKCVLHGVLGPHDRYDGYCKVCVDRYQMESGVRDFPTHVLAQTIYIERLREQDRRRETSIDNVPVTSGVYHASDTLRLSRSVDAFVVEPAEAFANLIEAIERNEDYLGRHQKYNEEEELEWNIKDGGVVE